jgi:hypothetical protein
MDVTASKVTSEVVAMSFELAGSDCRSVEYEIERKE